MKHRVMQGSNFSFIHLKEEFLTNSYLTTKKEKGYVRF